MRNIVKDFCLTLMADVAQLVRALVCGTKCRRFESDHPPQLMLNPCLKQGFYL